MKALFLSVVFLHLLILTLSENGYKFGDVISFSRKCICIPLYKHYALYVDNEYPGKGDIIHRTKKPFGNDIKFGQLKDEGKHSIEYNADLTEPEKELVKKRIAAVLESCDIYSLRSNNCEHLTYYLRSGKAVSKQPGTLNSYVSFCNTEKKCDAWDKKVKEIEENEKLEEECSRCENSNVAAG